MQQGNIHPLEHVERALTQFFREKNLTEPREMALRKWRRFASRTGGVHQGIRAIIHVVGGGRVISVRRRTNSVGRTAHRLRAVALPAEASVSASASVFHYLIPPIGVALAAISGEPITATLLVGAACILVGVAMAQMGSSEPLPARKVGA